MRRDASRLTSSYTNNRDAMHRVSTCFVMLLFGWKMGFEPTTFGTTIRRSNQLNYIHRIGVQNKVKYSTSQNIIFIFSK
jgi:hypothetical protein